MSAAADCLSVCGQGRSGHETNVYGRCHIITSVTGLKQRMFAHTQLVHFVLHLMHFQVGAANQTAWVCKLIADLMKADFA